MEARAAQSNLTIEFSTDKNRILIQNAEGVIVKEVDPHQLRSECKCALCVDEFTGVRLFQPEKIPEDVYPKNMLKKGNYAWAIVWSDGHRSSIYPIERVMNDKEITNLIK